MHVSDLGQATVNQTGESIPGYPGRFYSWQAVNQRQSNGDSIELVSKMRWRISNNKASNACSHKTCRYNT